MPENFISWWVGQCVKGMAKINAKNDGVFPFEPRPRHKKGEALVRMSQVSLKLWGRPLIEIMETIRRENEDNMPSPSWVDDLGSDYLRFLWLWQSRNNGSALARLGVWNCGNKLEVRDTIWKRNGQSFLWNYLRPSPRYLSQKRKLLFAVIRKLMKILAIFTPNHPLPEKSTQHTFIVMPYRHYTVNFLMHHISHELEQSAAWYLSW